jgi:predicted aspartyl protease
MSKIDHPASILPAAAACIAAVLACATALAAPAAAAETNIYSSYDESTLLPYVNAPAGDDDITASPKLRLAFGGASHLATLDTGSTGIVVSAADVPDADGLPSSPGQLLYSSSGRVMVGRWVTTPVTIEGADGTRLLVHAIPVLAVDRIECRPDARDCRPENAPKGVAVIGIGFGRETDGQEQSTPDKNPFLAASLPGGRFRRGYVVTRTGVSVGLTATVAGSGFAFAKLSADPDHPGDWSGAPFCVALNRTTRSACGASLVDTGVTGMYLTLPPAIAATSQATNAKGEPTLADGTEVAVAFPGGSPKAAGYSFTVGKVGDPLVPDFLILNTRRPEAFVNTGVRFLNGFDYLYDADGGFVGYRWTGRVDSAFGGAVPAAASAPGG